MPPRSSWSAFGVSLALTASFILWAILALGDGPLPAFDREAAHYFEEAARTHSFRRASMVVFTHLGGVPFMIGLAAVGLAWQWRRGDRVLAIGWPLIAAAGGLLNLALKEPLDRDRPPADSRDRAVSETNESFPSGHAMGAAIGYGLLGYAALQSIRRRDLRIGVVVLLAVHVGMIGFSRIYLRAHWFSDVIGGFMIGGAWLSFGLAWVSYVRARLMLP
ncbi:MAG: phosphatase PAP2 family protein [Gemmataceae bacterium]|nr:phosphatase PAP2 family protein [Gemmataceae bacterium]